MGVASTDVPNVTKKEVQLIKEIALPEGVSSARSMIIEPTGRLWFTEKVGKKLTMFDPQKNEFRTYTLPDSWGEVGFSQIALAPDGAIWFTVNRWVESKDTTHILGRFTPSDGYFTKYTLSVETFPEEVFVDPQGVIWFFASNKNNLYRVDPKSFKLKGYQIPTPNCFPRAMASDRHGDIWFVESNANKIGKFVPDREVFYEFDIPTPFANPGKISIDKKGHVWFVEQGANRIGVFYPDIRRFDEAIVPTSNSSPIDLVHDEKGNIWFLEYRGNKVGFFNPKQALFREYDIPNFGSFPADLVIDYKRSILWFTQSATEAKRLGMLSINDVLAADSKLNSVYQDQDNPSNPAEKANQGDLEKSTSTWIMLLVMAIAIAMLVALLAKRSGRKNLS